MMFRCKSLLSILCISLLSLSSFAAKVTICHRSDGQKETTKQVESSAVQMHLTSHGDSLGPCGSTPPPPQPPPINFTFPQVIDGNPVSVKTVLDSQVLIFDNNTPDIKFHNGKTKTLMVPVTGSQFSFNVQPVAGYTLKIRPIYKTYDATGIPNNAYFSPTTGDFKWQPAVCDIGHQVLFDVEQIDPNGNVANADAISIVLYQPMLLTQPMLVVPYEPTTSPTLNIAASPIVPTNVAPVTTINTASLNTQSLNIVIEGTVGLVVPVNSSSQVEGQLTVAGANNVGTKPLTIVGCINYAGQVLPPPTSPPPPPVIPVSTCSTPTTAVTVIPPSAPKTCTPVYLQSIYIQILDLSENCTP